MSRVLFHEKQRFTQWWLWILLLGIGYFLVAPLVTVIINREPFDFSYLIGPVIILLVILLMLSITLETQIKTEGVYVRFLPLIPKFKFYAWESLDKVYLRKYSPIGEYGGWGFRYGAYNIKGSQGLQLKFKNGKMLLIGTQRPEELQKVLDQFKSK